MEEIVSAEGVRIPNDLKRFIKSKLAHLDRFGANVRLVSVHLCCATDCPEQSKQCRVRLELRNGGYVSREFADSESAFAISEALARAERAVEAKLRRRRLYCVAKKYNL